MIKKSISILILLIAFISCKQDVDYFNGEVFIVEIPRTADTLKGQEIVLNDIYTGYMSVYDSIALFTSSRYSDEFINVFSLNSKELIGQSVGKGNGPNDFTRLSHRDNFFVDNNDLKLWLNNYDTQKLKLLNITQSIKKGSTIIDSVASFKKEPDTHYPFAFFFVVDNGQILARSSPNLLRKKEYEYIPTEYHLYQYPSQEKIRSYLLYNKPLIPKDTEYFNAMYSSYFHSFDNIKSDQSKVAMAMWMLPQINILDIQTGELKGFRLNENIDFVNLEKNDIESLKFYYSNICTDNNYIYALYLNTLMVDTEKHEETNEIHVFNWDGKFVKRIILEHSCDQIALDRKNNKLYTKDDEEKIFCYDLNTL